MKLERIMAILSSRDSVSGANHSVLCAYLKTVYNMGFAKTQNFSFAVSDEETPIFPFRFSFSQMANPTLRDVRSICQ